MLYIPPNVKISKVKVNNLLTDLNKCLKYCCIPNTTITIIIIIMLSKAWEETWAKLPEMPAHLQACISLLSLHKIYFFLKYLTFSSCIQTQSTTSHSTRSYHASSAQNFLSSTNIHVQTHTDSSRYHNKKKKKRKKKIQQQSHHVSRTQACPTMITALFTANGPYCRQITFLSSPMT